jgi:hypothetical protein
VAQQLSVVLGAVRQCWHGGSSRAAFHSLAGSYGQGVVVRNGIDV